MLCALYESAGNDYVLRHGEDAVAETIRGLHGKTSYESPAAKDGRGAAKIINYFLASFSPLWNHPSYGKAESVSDCRLRLNPFYIDHP